MGRLDDIIERNRDPRKAIRKRGGRRGVGIAGVVLFVVLLLLIFTDLASPPDDPPAVPPPPNGRVNDVYLGPAPAPADAATPVPR